LELGFYNHVQAREGLLDHHHAGTIEICYLVKGAQTYFLDEQAYRLTGGDVFIAFPNEEHSTGGLPQEKGVLYWLLLDLSPTDPLLGLDRNASADLARELRALPRRHFRGGRRLKEPLDHLGRLLFLEPTPRNRLEVTRDALDFLLGVVRESRQPAPLPRGDKLKPALEYIDENLHEPLTVPELAAQTSLSEPRFKARFKEELGMPPGEYVLRRKVREATRRLRAGRESVTDIAFALGFSSSQYFATVYKRFTGKTPASERRK
jgi:AraC-like DNA-binding protein